MKQGILARYDAYKDSGVEWLGEVPAHWIDNRHKDNFILIANRCYNLTLNKIGLENIEGKTGQFIPTDSIFDGNGIRFKINDILFGKLRPYLAKVYLAEFSGNAVGDIFVYRPKSNMLPRFAQYLMLSNRYIDVINSSTAGAKMPRVSSTFIANLPVITPPLSEQRAIAAYLDTQSAHIDRQIALLSQKAAHYAQLKQALINQSVTRGLDPSVPMKDSGIEWIGEIPAHWEVKRLKNIADVNPTSKFPHTPSNDDFVEFIPMTNVDGKLGQIRKFNIVPLRNVASGYTRFKNGDVIFAKITPCMENGNCAVVNGLQHNIGFGSTEFFVFRPGQLLTPFYLHYFLHNELFRKNAEPFMKGSAGQKRVTSLYMSTQSFPLPPLSEQRAIAAYLDTQTAHIDRIRATLNAKIAKLQELRKTLINDVVTGKIKVVGRET